MSSFAEMLDFRGVTTVISKGFWRIMEIPFRFINDLPTWLKYFFVLLMILFGIFVTYHVNKNKEEIWRIRT